MWAGLGTCLKRQVSLALGWPGEPPLFWGSPMRGGLLSDTLKFSDSLEGEAPQVWDPAAVLLLK